MRKTKWDRYIKEACILIENLGWIVSFSKKADDTCFIETKRITIKSYKNPRKRFYMLLHELGHLLHSRMPNYQQTAEKYEGKGKYSLLKYRVGIVEEEIIAWNIGEDIAKKNNWKFDKGYAVLKAQKLCTYMAWASKPYTKRINKKKATKK